MEMSESVWLAPGGKSYSRKGGRHLGETLTAAAPPSSPTLESLRGRDRGSDRQAGAPPGGIQVSVFSLGGPLVGKVFQVMYLKGEGLGN